MGCGCDRPDFKPRPLDYIEFVAWQTSAISLGGSAIAFFSVFEGELDQSSVQEAWRILCLRHPMLGATVQDGPAGPHFVPLSEFPVPQVRNATSIGVVEELLAWTGEVEFPSGAPLYKPLALLNPSTGKHAFLVVVNHAGGDADACLKVHKEFVTILNALKSGETLDFAKSRALPPSWCETLLPKLQRWRFMRSGMVELTRRFHCDLVPFEKTTPFAQRRTRRLTAVADVSSTRSLIERASEENGLSAFLSARLLQVQFSYMAARGLVGRRAKLVLGLPTNLRSLTTANRGVSMGTFPHSASVLIEANMSPQLAAQRVRNAIDEMTGAKAIGHLINWYSPFLVRRGLDQLVNGGLHFGPYTTHLGRIALGREGKLRRVATFGFEQLRHCICSLQGTTLVHNGRIVVGMNYCEPVVSRESAESIFHQFLNQIGIGTGLTLARDYDDCVTILRGP
jgi:hypothetical protein